jgi:EAL domain-containing protein (putative c-di-GMP-specific phosphodiesterase class I)
MLVRDAEHVIDALRQLKALGVQLAVDDFGTGYSSLSHLTHLPIDRLKIDRSFVCALSSTADDKAIAAAIIDMAESMHLGVIAEGVETTGQLDFLRAKHCQEVQGYYVSCPLPCEQAEAFLRQRTAVASTPSNPSRLQPA